MTDLVVIVPSRGRPDAAADLAATFTATGASARLVFAVDADDPTRHAYLRALDAYEFTTVHVVSEVPSTMVTALNHAAELYADEVLALGFMGDDHRPRTHGWDQLYLDVLRGLGTGIVYGDDLLQGPNIPTQCAMTADIVRALGHMAPQVLTHLYVDNYWKDLGEQAGCLRYLPSVVVEHMHPVAGKADWDDGHKRVNAPGMYQADADAYRRYAAWRLPADVEKVRALR